jgi:endo-1,4-beta-D-glucanase Y
MRERYDVCKLNIVSHFWLSDDDTRRFIKWQLDEEANDKKIIKSEEREYFFDWKASETTPLIKGGYHSMISEAYRAAMEMKIGIDYDETSNMMHI